MLVLCGNVGQSVGFASCGSAGAVSGHQFCPIFLAVALDAAHFRRMLFYSLINGLPVVWIIAVVHAGVGLAVDVTGHLWCYCCGLSDMEIRHWTERVWGWSGFGGIAVWASA